MKKKIIKNNVFFVLNKYTDQQLVLNRSDGEGP